MELRLDVYNEDEEIIKTYTKESYFIKMGLLKQIITSINMEQLADILSAGESLENNVALVKIGTSIVTDSYDMIMDLMKKIFKGLTDEECDSVPVVNVIKVLINLIKYTIDTIGLLGDKQKN